MSTVPDRTTEQAAALAAYCAVLDEDDADSRARWALWPATDTPEVRALDARIKARVAPGGPLDHARHAIRTAFGGKIPPSVEDEMCAEIGRRAFAQPGGWMIQHAMHGSGPLADACRKLLRPRNEGSDGR